MSEELKIEYPVHFNGIDYIQAIEFRTKRNSEDTAGVFSRLEEIRLTKEQYEKLKPKKQNIIINLKDFLMSLERTKRDELGEYIKVSNPSLPFILEAGELSKKDINSILKDFEEDNKAGAISNETYLAVKTRLESLIKELA